MELGSPSHTNNHEEQHQEADYHGISGSVPPDIDGNNNNNNNNNNNSANSLRSDSINSYYEDNDNPDDRVFGDQDWYDSSAPRSFQEYRNSSHFRELGACASLFLGVVVVYLQKPHQRPIPFQLLDSGDYVRNLTNDEQLRAQGETVPDWLLILLAIVLPLTTQLAMCYYQYTRQQRSSYHLHATACVYLVTTALNLLATEGVKLYAGYLRPIFYEGCDPDDTYSVCQTNNDVDSLRKSFPSGHASMSFAGLTVLTLFIHTQWGYGRYNKNKNNTYYRRGEELEERARRQQHHLIRQQQQQSSPDGSRLVVVLPPRRHHWDTPGAGRARFISLVGLLPMALALFIGASRVHDNKHFPADVVGGSILGASIAQFVFGLWFS